MNKLPLNNGKTRTALPLAVLLALATPSLAKDTDIYKVENAQNAMIVLDTSGSMAFPVYEHSIDYEAMYTYLAGRPGTNPIAPGWSMKYFYEDNLKFFERDRIYLVKPHVSSTGKTAVGPGPTNHVFAGDCFTYVNGYSYNEFCHTNAAQIDTHTRINAEGNLEGTGDGEQLLTVDMDGYVRYKGEPLPYTLNTREHEFTNVAGTLIDTGFVGSLQAPGVYSSGRYGNNEEVIPVGTSQYYTLTFMTGNFINMWYVAQMGYTQNGAWTGTGITVNQQHPKQGVCWTEPYPISQDQWPVQNISVDYPEGTGDYANNTGELDSKKTIESLGTTKIQLHFSLIDLASGDKIVIKDKSGAVLTTLTAADNTASGTWLPSASPFPTTGDTLSVHLESDGSSTAKGFTIDKIRSVESDEYKMQRRIDVARDALKLVIDNYGDKIAWGLTRYHTDGNNGGIVSVDLDPGAAGAAKRNEIKSALDGFYPEGGTPTMETLQDAWNHGFYDQRTAIAAVPCRTNIILSLTDGFPSNDTESDRIPGVSFNDWDGDGWTGDPSQVSTPNFYDDIAKWIFTHSWNDKSEISSPKGAADNVTVHNISFGGRQPLLQNATDDVNAVAGDEQWSKYLMASNKQQLVAAFKEIASSGFKEAAFVAPALTANASNRMDSGDKVYLSFFKQGAGGFWTGNLKKYTMDDNFQLLAKNGAPALSEEGTFISDAIDLWGGDNDHGSGAHDVEDDGVGEVLLKAVTNNFQIGQYYARKIYTANASVTPPAIMPLNQSVAPEKFGLASSDTDTRNKIVNFLHGYTYDAASGSGTPVNTRPWPLGAIIHSTPAVIEYVNTAEPNLPVTKTLIAVGANDGMLHVFDDADGKEVFAFVPPDQLERLKNLAAGEENDLYETVDGPITLYRRDKQPKYLIFGERRGGKHYICLDVSNPNPEQWSVKWDYTSSDLGQSWASVQTARLPESIVNAATGELATRDVVVFSGGYDTAEDNFPEPFEDTNSNGVKDESETFTDTNGNGVYDTFNPDPAGNSAGKSILVLDIDDPYNGTLTVDNVYDDLGQPHTLQLLPFSLTYGDIDVTGGNAQTRADMKYCFPATPSLITYTAAQSTQPKTNMFLALYAPDIYANLYKVELDLDVEPGNEHAAGWHLKGSGWSVYRLFQANPGYAGLKAGIAGAADPNDQGRKAFYGPTVSWGGVNSLFDAKIFSSSIKNSAGQLLEFKGKDKIAAVYYGTGDREHPLYAMTRNRVYAIYDDTSLGYRPNANPLGAFSSLRPESKKNGYTEHDLMNLSCDELGKDSKIKTCYVPDYDSAVMSCNNDTADADMKKWLKYLLRDDATSYPSDGSSDKVFEGDNGIEDDMKGWFIALDDQGGSVCTGHMEYPTSIDTAGRDNHKGEQIDAPLVLYFGNLYFTSYQPGGGGECSAGGNAFSYALSYDTASAAYNYSLYSEENVLDVTDRYRTVENAGGIPTGFTFIVKNGETAAMAFIGGEVVGPGINTEHPDLPGGTPEALKIKRLGTMPLFYWRDSNSQERAIIDNP